MHRRTFLAALPAALAACRTARPEAGTPYDGLASDDYLGPVATVARVDADAVFTEGPAWQDGEGGGGGALYFTNIPANVILRWEPAAERLTTAQTESGGANGLLFTPDGHLLACEGARRRVTRTDLATGAVEVLADQYDGRPLQAPNDLCLDRAGRVYFSSREGDPPPDANPKGVYRIDPDGTVHQLLAEPDLHMPNGLALSPDERTLYLIEADGGEGRHRDLRAYPRASDGSLGAPRVLHMFYPGRSGDGLAVDREGNLYVAAGLHARRGTSETLDTRPGIHVFRPDGTLVAFGQTPVDTVTNCCFGGEDRRTLYATCGPQLVQFRTRIPGLA